MDEELGAQAARGDSVHFVLRVRLLRFSAGFREEMLGVVVGGGEAGEFGAMVGGAEGHLGGIFVDGESDTSGCLKAGATTGWIGSVNRRRYKTDK